MVAGAENTCAIVGKELYCWGRNDSGQLGLDSFDAEVEPQRVSLDGEPQFVDIGGGTTTASTRAIVKGSDGTNKLYCWGNNQRGQLGLGETSDSESTPQLVTLDGEPLEASSSGLHACAVVRGNDGANKLYCWGRNDSGQLGLGPSGMNTLPSPQLVALDGEPQAVVSGAEHTCAIVKGSDNTNKLYCWGANGKGQLGLGDFDNESTPQLVALDGELQALTAGRDHTCAITAGSDGTNKLYCWGDNPFDNLGLGPDAPITQPTPRLVTLDSEPLAVEAGEYHTCAIAEGGDGPNKLYCWGHISAGRLGIPGFAKLSIPALVALDGEPQMVDLGRAHSCSITKGSDGANKLYCWGLNRSGQLGYGDTDDRSDTDETTPDKLPAIEF